MKAPIFIGYWNNHSNMYPEFPMPVAGTTDNTALVEQLQKVFNSAEELCFKGISCCRLCGCANGSTEYQLTVNGQQYRIPAGYVHYLTEHQIEPDPRLLEMLSAS